MSEVDEDLIKSESESIDSSLKQPEKVEDKSDPLAAAINKMVDEKVKAELAKQSFEAPRPVTIKGQPWVKVEFPEIQTVKGELTVLNEVGAKISNFPDIQKISGLVKAEVDFPEVQRIEGDVTAKVEFPDIQKVDVEFPEIQKIKGEVSLPGFPIGEGVEPSVAKANPTRYVPVRLTNGKYFYEVMSQQVGAHNQSTAVLRDILAQLKTGTLNTTADVQIEGADGAINDGVDSNIKATVLDYANSNPIAVRLTDTGGDYVSAGAGTQYTEDDAAAANPIGTMGMMVRVDVPHALTSNDGDNIAFRGTNKGEQFVKHIDAVPVFPSGIFTISGTHMPHTMGQQIINKLASIDTNTDGIEALLSGTIAVSNAGLTELAAAINSNKLDINIVTDAAGLATSAKQDTIIGHLDGVETLLTAIDANTNGIEGLLGGTLTVQATNLDIRDLTSASDSVSAVQGTTPWTVSGTFMPHTMGQSIINRLASIDTNTDGIEALLSGTLAVSNAGLTELAAAINSNRVDVNLSNSDITVPVSNAGLTELAAAINASAQMDVNIAANGIGLATSAKQDTIIGHLDGVETLLTDIDTNTDGIEGLLTTIDADTGNISTKIDTLAGAVSGTEVQVDVLTMPTTTVQATNLDIRDLTSASDSVAAVQSGAWSVTANAGTNLNTSALALESGGNLAGAATSLALIDDTVTADKRLSTGTATDIVIQSGNVPLAVKRQPVNVSSDGQILISGVANRRIRVLGGFLITGAALTAEIKSGNNSAASGPLPLIANEGFIIPYAETGNFETLTGQNLTISKSAAGNIGGWLVYVEV